MVKTRQLTYDKIAETEIDECPVIHAEFPDTESFMNVIFDKDEDLLRVAQVESRAKGDMSRILDDMTAQLDCWNVRFMVPIGDALEKRLTGFERREETVEDRDGNRTVEILDGEWIPGDQSEQGDSNE